MCVFELCLSVKKFIFQITMLLETAKALIVAHITKPGFTLSGARVEEYVQYWLKDKLYKSVLTPLDPKAANFIDVLESKIRTLRWFYHMRCDQVYPYGRARFAKIQQAILLFYLFSVALPDCAEINAILCRLHSTDKKWRDQYLCIGVEFPFSFSYRMHGYDAPYAKIFSRDEDIGQPIEYDDDDDDPDNAVRPIDISLINAFFNPAPGEEYVDPEEMWEAYFAQSSSV
jgi:hypothetical protein